MSSNPLTYPKLRAVDARPHRQNGQEYLLLHDPLQLADETLLVPRPLATALAFCDGAHTIQEVCQAFAEHAGYSVEVESVRELLGALDNALLLENRRSSQACLQLLQEYRSAPFRQPALAGPSYPADPDKLRALLDDYLAQAERMSGANSNTEGDNILIQQGCRGLLSPHIDYQRGGVVYAQVWQQAAAAAQAADVVIIFGTDHQSHDPLTLTRQNYATPYGVLPTAVDIVDALAEVIGEEAAFDGELRHRDEHSLELVTVWLHHMRGGAPCALVPILCGGFHRFIHAGGDPADDPLLKRVWSTLIEQCTNRQVLVVASGDLAHVGPAFGGAPLNTHMREILQQADSGLIKHMTSGSTGGFFESIRQVEDRNNVCGVAPIYLTMQILKAMDAEVGAEVSGTQTGYAVCPADATNTSVVTVGGVIFS